MPKHIKQEEKSVGPETQCKPLRVLEQRDTEASVSEYMQLLSCFLDRGSLYKCGDEAEHAPLPRGQAGSRVSISKWFTCSLDTCLHLTL